MGSYFDRSEIEHVLRDIAYTYKRRLTHGYVRNEERSVYAERAHTARRECIQTVCTYARYTYMQSCLQPYEAFPL